MRRYHLIGLLHVLVPAMLATSVLFAAASPSLAQNAGTAAATAPSTPPSGDDSDELPIYLNITGYVQEVTATSIHINNQIIVIPTGMTLPPEIAVGKIASIHGNLRDDDTIIIITIVAGYHLPTPTPQSIPSATPISTQAGTPSATLPATPESTVEPHSTVPPIGAPVAGCNKPGQEIAVALSGAYAMPYSQIVDLHCKGYSYGVIARTYLLILAGEDEGKNLTVPVILELRARGNHWNVIIVILDVHPDSTLIIFVLDGGKASFFTDCGGKGNRKKSRLCGVSPQGQGGQQGDKNGKKGDDDKGDD